MNVSLGSGAETNVRLLDPSQQLQQGNEAQEAAQQAQEIVQAEEDAVELSPQAQEAQREQEEAQDQAPGEDLPQADAGNVIDFVG